MFWEDRGEKIKGSGGVKALRHRIPSTGRWQRGLYFAAVFISARVTWPSRGQMDVWRVLWRCGGRVRGGIPRTAVLTNTAEGCARVSTGSVRIHGLESRRWPRGSAAGQPLIRLTTTCVDSLQMPLMWNLSPCVGCATETNDVLMFPPWRTLGANRHQLHGACT